MRLFTFFENIRFLPHAAAHGETLLIEDSHIRFYEGIIHEDVLFTFKRSCIRRTSYLNRYTGDACVGSTMAKAYDRNVRDLICVREMRKWVNAHADEVDDGFLVPLRAVWWITRL